MPVNPFARRSRVPAEALRVVSLAPGERALTSAPLVPRGHAVATERALLLGSDAGDEGERLPWWQMLGASWEGEGLRLTVEVLEAGRPRVRRLELAEETLLPEAVRERVQSSIVVSRHVRLSGRGGVRLVARRIPGQDELVWQEVFDAGVDPSDPAVRTEVAAALQELRGQML